MEGNDIEKPVDGNVDNKNLVKQFNPIFKKNDCLKSATTLLGGRLVGGCGS